MSREEKYLLALARERYRGSLYRVALYLFLRLDFEHYGVINQALIAEDLEMERPEVNVIIKELVEDNYLVMGEKVGRHNTYKLEYQYADDML